MKARWGTCRSWALRNAGRAACGEGALITAHGAFDSRGDFRQSCPGAKEARFTFNLAQGCYPEMKIPMKTSEILISLIVIPNWTSLGALVQSVFTWIWAEVLAFQIPVPVFVWHRIETRAWSKAQIHPDLPKAWGYSDFQNTCLHLEWIWPFPTLKAVYFNLSFWSCLFHLIFLRLLGQKVSK